MDPTPVPDTDRHATYAMTALILVLGAAGVQVVGVLSERTRSSRSGRQ
jgi:hypothetical protein